MGICPAESLSITLASPKAGMAMNSKFNGFLGPKKQRQQKTHVFFRKNLGKWCLISIYIYILSSWEAGVVKICGKCGIRIIIYTYVYIYILIHISSIASCYMFQNKSISLHLFTLVVMDCEGKAKKRQRYEHVDVQSRYLLPRELKNVRCTVYKHHLITFTLTLREATDDQTHDI